LAAKHVLWGELPGSASKGNGERRSGPGGKQGGSETDDIQWFVGIDWVSQAYQAGLIDAAGKIIGERSFAHGGVGLAELCAWLLAMTRPEPCAIAVAIEVPHGPIVETLPGARVPGLRGSTRSSSTASATGLPSPVPRDDRRDAHVLSGSLRRDPHCFRRLAAEDAVAIELREWSRMTEDLQQPARQPGAQAAVAPFPAGFGDR